MAQHRLPIQPHLTHDEIERRYRACRSGLEKTHWQVLWLLTRPDRPLTPAQAAEQVGRPTAWPTAASGPTAARPGSRPSSGPRCTTPFSNRRPTAGCGPGPSWPPTPATASAWPPASRPGGTGCETWA